MAIELTLAAKALLAKRGYDPVLGARPLRRTIQREIEDPMSEKMLFGDLKPGEIVIIDVEGEGDEATFSIRGEFKGELSDIEITPVDVAGVSE
jgi:ATP-dependent Clp protease ATP-binding subunit ClpC